MTQNQHPNILVAGHRGLVGSALVRCLIESGAKNLILKSRQELDLLDQAAVHSFFKSQRIDQVYLAAARVGGVYANDTFSADFLYENLVISTNVIHAAAETGVGKLLFLGSSCIYPKFAKQPITEDSLLTGPLEHTNEAYAIAKIAGLKLCEKYQIQYGKKFISGMPTNLYGPGDNFHPTHSHVIPGLLRRFHEAKVNKSPTVTVWGDGTPLREFLHVDDLAKALVLLMEKYNEKQTINIGSGQEVTIATVSEMIAKTVGYQGKIVFDSTKPNGTPRKILDSSRIHALGWKAKFGIEEGLRHTYEWALKTGAL